MMVTMTCAFHALNDFMPMPRW